MFTGTLESVRSRFSLASSSERIRYLQNGAVFAVISIRTHTELAERRYTQFIMNGRSHKNIKGLMSSQRETIDAILSLTYHDWLGVISSPFPELELSWKVKGLGITKASFALASAGVGVLGCIDSRIWNLHRDILTPILGKNGSKLYRKTTTAYNLYLLALATLYPNATKNYNGLLDYALCQWESWLEEFNTSSQFKTEHQVLTHYV